MESKWKDGGLRDHGSVILNLDPVLSCSRLKGCLYGDDPW